MWTFLIEHRFLLATFILTECIQIIFASVNNININICTIEECYIPLLMCDDSGIKQVWLLHGTAGIEIHITAQGEAYKTSGFGSLLFILLLLLGFSWYILCISPSS